MHEYKIVSQLDSAGYFYKEEIAYGDLMPHGAVDTRPPQDLSGDQVARFDFEAESWVIESDPLGIHAPCFDINTVDIKDFIYVEKDVGLQDMPRFSLAPIRCLAKDVVRRVAVHGEERLFRFRGIEIENRLIYLNNNIFRSSKEVLDYFSQMQTFECFDNNSLNFFRYKISFGMEQSVYAMKLVFDFLIRIAAKHTDNHDFLDFSMGKLFSKPNKEINSLIFKNYSQRDNDFIKILNQTANCYKHSFFQHFGDMCNLSDYLELYIVDTTSRKDTQKPLEVIRVNFIQLLYAYFNCLKLSMESIKSNLPPEQIKYIKMLESSPFGYI